MLFVEQIFYVEVMCMVTNNLMSYGLYIQMHEFDGMMRLYYIIIHVFVPLFYRQ